MKYAMDGNTSQRSLKHYDRVTVKEESQDNIVQVSSIIQARLLIN